MSSPFVAEVRIWARNYAPTGWAFCNGQLMPISQNTALFSLLGTTYGGDGKSTFALPDLQGNSPMHPGQGSGLSQRFLGEIGGEEFVTLLDSEMPSHTHQFGGAAAAAGDVQDPTGAVWAQVPGRSAVFLYLSPPTGAMNNMNSMIPAGGSLPHNNMQPYLTLNFCIALQGIFRRVRKSSARERVVWMRRVKTET
jgi:microcystin-dependent protein